MRSILLQQVLPNVFASGGVESDVWMQQLPFYRGSYYLIESASGSGKSSLCSFLTGYRTDYSGVITFDGEDISSFDHCSWSKIRRGSIAMLFQELRLFSELTALENIEIKNNLTGYKSRGEITTMLERLGLGDKLDSPVAKLSFGQQQRVAIVRALAQPFDFIILDEPISHLDGENSRIVSELLIEEASREGSAIIVTSIGRHLDLPYDKILKL